MSRNIDAMCLSKPGTINLPWGVADQLDVDEYKIEAHYDVSEREKKQRTRPSLSCSHD